MSAIENKYTLLKPELRERIDDEHERKRSQFLRDYYENTGRPWIHFYPRDKPMHYMYPADFEGQTWTIESQWNHYEKCPADAKVEEQPEDPLHGFNEGHCRVNNEPHEFDITLLCDSPRIYQIFNFISDHECEELIKTGHKTGFKRSTVADSADVDPTRTSETVWVERHLNKAIDNILKRVSDTIHIDDSLLNMSNAAETLQLVKYENNQYYNYHVDYETYRANSRYITFLMYLNDVEAGGQTGFRNAHCWDKGKHHFAVDPIKGSAVFFYDLLPDGNADDRSLHSGMHIKKGHKYMTNLWIYDKCFYQDCILHGETPREEQSEATDPKKRDPNTCEAVHTSRCDKMQDYLQECKEIRQAGPDNTDYGEL